MLFGRKKDNPYLKSEYREWIEKLLFWLSAVMDEGYLYERPFFDLRTLPSRLKVSVDSPEFLELYYKVCRDLQILPERVSLSVLEDVPKDRLRRIFGKVIRPQAAGLYLGSTDIAGKDCEVWLSEKAFREPQGLLATLAHEMSHVKLLGEGILRQDHRDMERITDLSLVFFGYGIPKINSIEGKAWFANGQTGYVSQELIGHGLACMAYLRGKREPHWLEDIRPRLRKYVLHSLRYLQNGGEHQLGKA